MSDIIHKIKDAVTHHHHDDHVKDKKPETASNSHAHAKPKAKTHRNDRDLNCAPSNTHDAPDLTGRHVAPDDRDIDGRRRSHSHDAPDLTGPHRDHLSVDINGHAPSTHNPPDLNSPTASPTSRH